MRNSTSSRDASSPAKRRKHDPELVANDLDVWQEFAAEHYEMVEQYPLELHRNFRLLRELDDECIGECTVVCSSGQLKRKPCIE